MECWNRKSAVGPRGAVQRYVDPDGKRGRLEPFAVIGAVLCTLPRATLGGAANSPESSRSRVLEHARLFH